MKPVVFFAVGCCAFVVFGPHMSGSETENGVVVEEEANIIRAEPEKTERTRTETKRKSRSTSASGRSTGSSCYKDSDVGLNICPGKTRTAAVRSTTSKKTKAEKRAAESESVKTSGPMSVVVDRNSSGHFSLNARMNGSRVSVLVDTGATGVAIDTRTARRLGINLKREDFRHEAQTANGIAKFARTNIKSIRIKGIVIDDVDAMVLEEGALSQTLLGMSFLNRLSKYQVENGKLKMFQ